MNQQVIMLGCFWESP